MRRRDQRGAGGARYEWRAREERDSWLNWPARVAALIAAELGAEAHAVQKTIEAHVRGHLSELAEVRPEFR
jgi:hypothetical protein